jgi:hypothetical protein
MTTHWEPGTYGEATLWNGDVVHGVWGPGACFTDGTQDFTPGKVTSFRPLVVLDLPDPAVTLTALRAEIAGMAHGPIRRALEGLANQIGAQTRPPRPPEPTGWGAVVVDGQGRRWRLGQSAGDRCWWGQGHKVGVARWSDIPGPVRVLWDGTDPEAGA